MLEIKISYYISDAEAACELGIIIFFLSNWIYGKDTSFLEVNLYLRCHIYRQEIVY